MKTIYLFIGLFICKFSFSQDITDKLDRAMSRLAGDGQFSHSILSMYIVDGKTGRVLYDKNGQLGLAPASCQKVVTSVSAFELLGKDYQYQTLISISPGVDSAVLYVYGSGDPTLGSWLWSGTSMDSVYETIYRDLKKENISILGINIGINQEKFNHQPIPDGWVWQDIGNYYGAGAWSFNWHENQYRISLQSGDKEGDHTIINNFDPEPATMEIKNYITTGKKGSGDNAYIYSAPYNRNAFAMGTIPPDENKFVISGSMPDPSIVFTNGLLLYLNKKIGIQISKGDLLNSYSLRVAGRDYPKPYRAIDTIFSPKLDSINYWFLKKSINLYGEAFVKTIAYEKTKVGSTDTGVNIIRSFWADKGIEKSSLKIIDGSGLSPANRVTTAALVAILQYAKQRPWFSSFYYALPEINGIKMKDGYIGGVRAYTGYIKSATGAEYSFSFIVNNFDGNPATAREKMWKVLDLLK